MFGMSGKQVLVHAALAVVAVAIAKRIPFTAAYL
jgi:hypothetical protein